MGAELIALIASTAQRDLYGMERARFPAVRQEQGSRWSRMARRAALQLHSFSQRWRSFAAQRSTLVASAAGGW
jgi:hypothetical protein